MMRFVLALLNLLGFPGVGTYLAGHKRTGIIQIIIHIIGMGLSVGGFCFIIPSMMPAFKNPDTLSDYIINGGMVRDLPTIGIPLLIAALGAVIFLVNWFWSATTTKPLRQEPPPIPGHPER